MTGNLVVAALLDVHARIAAENRGDPLQPEATLAVKTVVQTGDDDATKKDDCEVRIQNA